MLRLASRKREWLVVARFLWIRFRHDAWTTLPEHVERRDLRLFASIDAILASKHATVVVECNDADLTQVTGVAVMYLGYGQIFNNTSTTRLAPAAPPWAFWDLGAEAATLKSGGLTRTQLRRLMALQELAVPGDLLSPEEGHVVGAVPLRFFGEGLQVSDDLPEVLADETPGGGGVVVKVHEQLLLDFGTDAVVESLAASTEPTVASEPAPGWPYGDDAPVVPPSGAE